MNPIKFKIPVNVASVWREIVANYDCESVHDFVELFIIELPTTLYLVKERVDKLINQLVLSSKCKKLYIKKNDRFARRRVQELKKVNIDKNHFLIYCVYKATKKTFPDYIKKINEFYFSIHSKDDKKDDQNHSNTSPFIPNDFSPVKSRVLLTETTQKKEKKEEKVGGFLYFFNSLLLLSKIPLNEEIIKNSQQTLYSQSSLPTPALVATVFSTQQKDKKKESKKKKKDEWKGQLVERMYLPRNEARSQSGVHAKNLKNFSNFLIRQRFFIFDNPEKVEWFQELKEELEKKNFDFTLSHKTSYKELMELIKKSDLVDWFEEFKKKSFCEKYDDLTADQKKNRADLVIAACFYSTVEIEKEIKYLKRLNEKRAKRGKEEIDLYDRSIKLDHFKLSPLLKSDPFYKKLTATSSQQTVMELSSEWDAFYAASKVFFALSDEKKKEKFNSTKPNIPGYTNTRGEANVIFTGQQHSKKYAFEHFRTNIRLVTKKIKNNSKQEEILKITSQLMFPSKAKIPPITFRCDRIIGLVGFNDFLDVKKNKDDFKDAFADRFFSNKNRKTNYLISSRKEDKDKFKDAYAEKFFGKDAHIDAKTGYNITTYKLLFNQVRIIPKTFNHVAEISYKREVKTLDEINERYSKRALAIDIGVNNLLAIVDNLGSQPLLYSGGESKYIVSIFGKNYKLAQQKLYDLRLSNNHTRLKMQEINELLEGESLIQREIDEKNLEINRLKDENKYKNKDRQEREIEENKEIINYIRKEVRSLKNEIKQKGKSMGKLHKELVKIEVKENIVENLKALEELRRPAERHNRRFNDHFHKVSRKLIELCLERDIDTIGIGYNSSWKQNAKFGRKNTRFFQQIPFYTLIRMIQYKAHLAEIKVILGREPYTSKCSAYDFEAIGYKKDGIYMGVRAPRIKVPLTDKEKEYINYLRDPFKPDLKEVTRKGHSFVLRLDETGRYLLFYEKYEGRERVVKSFEFRYNSKNAFKMVYPYSLFYSIASRIYIHSDINGAFNIGRLLLPDLFGSGFLTDAEIREWHRRILISPLKVKSFNRVKKEDINRIAVKNLKRRPQRQASLALSGVS